MKISDIQRYDSKKMYEAYDYWPKSAKEHYEKDFSKLENFTDEDLLKTSLLLHEVYNSYDLSFYLSLIN